MNKVDLIITNIGKLVTVSTGGTNQAKFGKNMSDLAILENVAVIIKDNLIHDILPSLEWKNKYACENIIEANSKLVTPGFVDPHTHLIWGGLRDEDLKLRMGGATYLEILENGGGIYSTVNKTRKASFETLYQDALEKLKLISKHGTTCLEIKSGYGLNYETELKMLEVINKLKRDFDFIDIVPTFLGAHTFPKDLSRKEYLDILLNKCLPDFKSLARFCDVFSEKGAFSYDEAKSVLEKAKSLNYELKIHSGQFTNNGSTIMASNLGALSCDHLDNLSDEDIQVLKQNKTSALLMPESIFFLLGDKYPDARKLISNDVIVSLATDINPGSAPGFSMQFVIALAFYKMKMSVEECIVASTINAAYSIKENTRRGSVEIGKEADLIVFEINKPIEIPYYFGTNLVKYVIKSGKLLKN